MESILDYGSNTDIRCGDIHSVHGIPGLDWLAMAALTELTELNGVDESECLKISQT